MPWKNLGDSGGIGDPSRRAARHALTHQDEPHPNGDDGIRSPRNQSALVVLQVEAHGATAGRAKHGDQVPTGGCHGDERVLDFCWCG